jgi:excisionase family DNA binding protein
MSRGLNSILVNAEEATELLGVSAIYFIRLFDKGLARPELNDKGQFLFDLKSLRQIALGKQRPNYFPESEYATIDQAVHILDITRKTFYNRVKRGKIKIHRCGKRTFIKRADLYADDELF